MQVVSRDGQPLGAEVYAPQGPPVGRIVCLHAMMVDRRSLRGAQGLPGVLADAGFEVWVPDFRGRGLSPRDAGWTYDDIVRGDIAAWITRARADALPLGVVGHSLGGHAALAAATEGWFADAYVTLGANIWMPSLDSHRARNLARELAMRVFRGASAGGRFPARQAHLGPVDEASDYVRDLARFWDEDRWRARDGVDWGERMRALNVPLLSIAGSGDRLLAHPVMTEAFARRVPDAQFRVEGPETGLSFDPGHMELLTDARARPIWRTVAAWLRGWLTPGSSRPTARAR